MTPGDEQSGSDHRAHDRHASEQRVQRAFDEVVARHEQRVDMAGALVRATAQRDRRRSQRRRRLASIAAGTTVALLAVVGALDVFGRSSDGNDNSGEMAVEAVVTMPKPRSATTSPQPTQPTEQTAPDSIATSTTAPSTACIRVSKALADAEIAPPGAAVAEGPAPQVIDPAEPATHARFWMQGSTTVEVTIPAVEAFPVFGHFAVEGSMAFFRPEAGLSAVWILANECSVGVRAWSETAPDSAAVIAHTTALRITELTPDTMTEKPPCPPEGGSSQDLEPRSTLRLLYFTCSFDDLGVEEPFPIPWHPTHPSPPSPLQTVEALVDGTPEGYFSAFPLYVSASQPSVTVDQGVATVDLDFDDPAFENALLADTDLQDLLLDQLAAVLFQFDGIDEVNATPLCCEDLRLTRSVFVADSAWFQAN